MLTRNTLVVDGDASALFGQVAVIVNRYEFARYALADTTAVE